MARGCARIWIQCGLLSQFGGALLFLTLVCHNRGVAEGSSPPLAGNLPARLIGATATVIETSTGFRLPARVDTGATSCSIHCNELRIIDAAPDPKQNIGKVAKFRITGGDGKSKWVRTKIVGHVVVKTAERDEQRYKVRMRLRVDEVEKDVLVTLNDREKMTYPVLLGRNFLRDDFLVNVSLDASE